VLIRKMRDEQIKTTAYHEAGHLVAAYVLGLEYHGATIKPGEGYTGKAHVPLIDKMRYESDVDEEDYLYRHLLVCLAAPKAVELLNGSPLSPDDPNFVMSNSGSDYSQAGDIVLSLAGSIEEEQVALARRAQKDTESRLREYWGAVEAVAAALLERETLNTAECKKIMDAHI
jgi:ATP-dependent Zn protease